MFTYAAKLIEVIDGDTVDLLIDLGFGVHVRERCRLYGIDAPEMPTAQGQAAKAYLESLIGAATGGVVRSDDQDGSKAQGEDRQVRAVFGGALRWHFRHGGRRRKRSGTEDSKHALEFDQSSHGSNGPC